MMNLALKIFLVVLTAVVSWLLAALQYKPKWKDGRTTLAKKGRKSLFYVLALILIASLVLTCYEHYTSDRSMRLAHEERDEIKEMLKPFANQAVAQFPDLSKEQAIRELASHMQLLNKRLLKTEIDIKKNKADELFGSAYEAEQRKDHTLAASLYMDALLTMLEVPSLEGVQLMARQTCINLSYAKRANQEFLPSTQKELDDVIRAISKHSWLGGIKLSVNDLEATRQSVFGTKESNQ
jgi:hypothetical protein